ncbi:MULTISPECIES: folate family ECF transporter S component [unclassified Levilactobacillus]|uniref:folate family ECF transporter S component n=1 Tax=Lactobacillaceae TaxID=33958 RepID=UPI002FF13B2B
MTVESRLPKLSTLSLVTMGLLMALQLVIKSFSVGPAFLKFSFTFLVAALIARLFGPWWGMMTAAVVDVIGTLMSGGPFFIGFTISAILGSLIYALFLYRQPVSWSRLIIAQVLISVVVNALLNTLWVAIMYKTPFWGLLPVRLLKEGIMTPIQIVLLYLLFKSQVVARIQQRLKL